MSAYGTCMCGGTRRGYCGFWACDRCGQTNVYGDKIEMKTKEPKVMIEAPLTVQAAMRVVYDYARNTMVAKEMMYAYGVGREGQGDNYLLDLDKQQQAVRAGDQHRRHLEEKERQATWEDPRSELVLDISGEKDETAVVRLSVSEFRDLREDPNWINASRYAHLLARPLYSGEQGRMKQPDGSYLVYGVETTADG